jgi:hypothetical protein
MKRCALYIRWFFWALRGVPVLSEAAFERWFKEGQTYGL